MKPYVIKKIQHRNLQNKLLPPIYRVLSSDDEFIFASHTEDVAKDVMYLLNMARHKRLTHVFGN